MDPVPAVSSAVEQEEMEEERMAILLKLKICVFCASVITDDENNYYNSSVVNSSCDPPPVQKIPPVSQDTFLQGISILCEILNAPDGCKKFANLEEWALLGYEDFVGLVCCKQCALLMEEIVSMHHLILATQASLDECVGKITDCMIESERRIDGGNLEYSVNACVHFRESILQSLFQAPKVCHIVNLNKSTRSSSRLRSKIKSSNDTSVATDPVSQSHMLSLSTPFVKLERLNLITTGEVINDNGNHGDTGNDLSGFDDNDSCPDAYPSDFKRRNKSKKEDDDYRPVAKRRGKCVGKRGRRGIHQRLPREKGRPLKESTVLEDGEVKPKRGRKTSSKIDELNEKEVSETKLADDKVNHLTQETEDDEYRPSDHEADDDNEFHPPPRKRSRKSTTSSRSKRTRQDNPLKVTKKPGRPAKVGSRCYRILHEEGPKHHKPIYILDATPNHLMFYNVKFQKTPYFLQCLHPDCSHTEPITGYFTDQVTFRNFRFHVRYQHRSKYKCVDDSTKNLYYCHLCDTHQESRDLLMEHRRTLHANFEMPPVVCEVCGDTMPQSQIVKHTISHKNDEEKELAMAQKPKRKGQVKDITKPLSFPCDECSKTFKTHTELRIHKQCHVPVEIRRQYVCELCGKKFISVTTVEIHKRRVHLKDVPTPYECRICNKKFLQYEKNKYDDHIRMHTGDKPFQCKTCGKRFHSKWSLTMHERLHTDQSVTCEFCSKIYKSVKYLKRHHVKHHPELVQRSDSRETKKSKNLEHREDFIGPKLLFPCEPCGHQYVYRSMLVAHLKGKHSMTLAKNEDYPNMWTMEDQHLVQPQGSCIAVRTPKIKRSTPPPDPLSEHDGLISSDYGTFKFL